MRLHTFYSCDDDGFSTCFVTRNLPFDSAAFPLAGELIAEHPSADHVAVWDDDRSVLLRYREGPVLRPVASNRPVPSCAPEGTA